MRVRWTGGFDPRARRGRDNSSGSADSRRPCFDPRARRGRDARMPVSVLGARSFRSTRPQGARPLRGKVPQSFLTFRSTRPQGARRRRTILDGRG